MGVVRAAGTAGTIAVSRDRDANAVGTKMRDLAEKIDGGLGVSVFKFAVGGAHAAEGADLAMRANGFAGGRNGADVLQLPFPAFAESGVAIIKAVLVREHANGHAAGGVDGAAVMAAAAGVALRWQGNLRQGTFVVKKAKVFAHTGGIPKFESNGLFGGEADTERTLGAVRAGIDKGIEFEFNAEVLFGEALHFIDFVNVDGSWNGFQFEGEMALEEEANAGHAAIEGAGNTSEVLVGFARSAIESDFDGEGAIFGKMIGDARSDHGAIGKKSDEEAFFLGEGVDFEKILAGKDLATGEKEPQAAGFDEFIEEESVFLQRELALAGLRIANGQIVVAMLAIERAAMRDFEGDFGGHTAPLVPRMHLR